MTKKVIAHSMTLKRFLHHAHYFYSECILLYLGVVKDSGCWLVRQVLLGYSGKFRNHPKQNQIQGVWGETGVLQSKVTVNYFLIYYAIPLVCIKLGEYKISKVELCSFDIFLIAQLLENNGKIIKSPKGAARNFMRKLFPHV